LWNAIIQNPDAKVGRKALKNRRTGFDDDLGVMNIGIEHIPPIARLINSLLMKMVRI
jgi:hypothetical protein